MEEKAGVVTLIVSSLVIQREAVAKHAQLALCNVCVVVGGNYYEVKP